ncbi:hypothetical protein OG948_60615 (plasmid) [Embleya sp. NBC_00888]|uniref:hypothetical protein n=1 Tax=Embleya sp. NBC_00888 TaxID=2975960 RepID=UPI002F9153D4|nr:hypothetical protein OG948_60615 [Embleya sp. NBC_00888]
MTASIFNWFRSISALVRLAFEGVALVLRGLVVAAVVVSVSRGSGGSGARALFGQAGQGGDQTHHRAVARALAAGRSLGCAADETGAGVEAGGDLDDAHGALVSSVFVIDGKRATEDGGMLAQQRSGEAVAVGDHVQGGDARLPPPGPVDAEQQVVKVSMAKPAACGMDEDLLEQHRSGVVGMQPIAQEVLEGLHPQARLAGGAALRRGAVRVGIRNPGQDGKKTRRRAGARVFPGTALACGAGDFMTRHPRAGPALVGEAGTR